MLYGKKRRKPGTEEDNTKYYRMDLCSFDSSETQKERHDRRSCLSFGKGWLKSIFLSETKYAARRAAHQLRAQR